MNDRSRQNPAYRPSRFSPVLTTRVCCSLILTLVAIIGVAKQDEVPSQLTGVAVYDWLGHHAVMDRSVSNATINELISNGITTEDDQLRGSVIGALAWIAAYINLDLPKHDPLYVERTVAELTELKDFLLHELDQGLKRHPQPWTMIRLTNKENNSNKAIYVELRNGRTVWKTEWAWLTIPATLVTLYPSDSDVHTAVWDISDSNHRLLTLTLLDTGRFSTPKARSLRIQSLLDKHATLQVQIKAAHGLGRFQSSKGLATLVAKLQHTSIPEALLAIILDSIGSYDEKDRKVYEESITTALKDTEFIVPEKVKLEAPPGEVLTYLMFLVASNQHHDMIDRLLQLKKQ